MPLTRSKLKLLALALAKYSGLFLLCRWYTRKDLRILAYHGIWLGEGHYGNYLYMSANKFASRMEKLRELNVPIVELSDGLSMQRAGTLPNCATVITIDDGWYSTYLRMLPALEKNGFPATIYVTTYYCQNEQPVLTVLLQYMLDVTGSSQIDLAALGINGYGKVLLASDSEKEKVMSVVLEYASLMSSEKKKQELLAKVGRALGVDYAKLAAEKVFNLVSLEQLKEIHDRGFDLQLHTHRHRIYNQGEICLRDELIDNKAVLSEISDRHLKHFCYPSGLYNERVYPSLEAANICSATTTEPGLVRHGSSKFALPRILDGELVSDLEFEAEICGFLELKRRILNR